eukprot:TRINITY_DN2951_c0_g1_i1.p1 TRINITY_DN2951_c0_g1~~TRINITY_DN2951_c0_g1_i1.p1  ORF type:complete len:904 (+),score=362.31 TRINITY_DN2951_c0_g1_i1:96-2714(+)
MALEGVLEKRGTFRRWSPVALRLQGRKCAVLDLAEAGKPDAKPVDLMIIEHWEKTKDSQFSFQLYFQGVASRQGGAAKSTKWLLRAKEQEQYQQWIDALSKAMSGGGSDEAQPDAQQQQEAGAAPAAAPADAAERYAAYSYGLPPNDPRSDLPLIMVPHEWTSTFGFLNSAVIHWFGSVKTLTGSFESEERIIVLGDTHLYACKPNADVDRCIQVKDIKKLLVAQDAKKELYIIICMPDELPPLEMGGEVRKEHDWMFHSADIKTFVRFLRTVFLHQTEGQMLPLEQLRDKQQLEKEVRLARRDGYRLIYTQPLMKEALVRLLEVWLNSEKAKEAEKNKAHYAEMLADSGDGGLPQGETPAPAPPPAAAPAPAAAAPAAPPAAPQYSEEDRTTLPPGGENDPLGRLLAMNKLAQYYPKLKKLGLEPLAMLDDKDLQHFGVDDADDRAKLLACINDDAALEAAKKADPKTFGKGGDRHADPAADSVELDLDTTDDLTAPSPTAKPPPKLQSLQADEERQRDSTAREEKDARCDIEAVEAAFSPLVGDCDAGTELGRFLRKLRLPQYYQFLTKKEITFETMTCGLVDDQTLRLVGVDNAEHRARLLKGIEEAIEPDFVPSVEGLTLSTVETERAQRAELRADESRGRTQIEAKFTESMPAPQEVDDSDPLGRWLKAIGLDKYYWGLSEKDMSLDVMTSGLFDEDDLRNHCEINSDKDRKKILLALRDPDLKRKAEAGPLERNSWTLASAAHAQFLASQAKIAELGGVDYQIDTSGVSVPKPAPPPKNPPRMAAPDDDLLGGPPAPAAPAVDDDDLLGGPAPAKPAAAAIDDDDLLGGPAPAAAPAAGGIDDDDLLGGPAPAAAPAAAPIDDDLL